MKKFIVLTAMLVVMCVSTSQAKIETILIDGAYLFNDAGGDAVANFFTSTFPDATVTRGDYTDTANAGVQSTIEAADLLVISRRTFSGAYGTADAEYYATLQIPVIYLTSYVTRSSRMVIEGGDNAGGDITGTETTVTADGAAILGVAAGSYDWLATGADTLGTGSVGTGKILATVGGNTLAAGWDPGDTDASARVQAGRRLLWNLNATDGGTVAQLPDTAAGLEAFTTAVITYAEGAADLTLPHDPIPANGADSIGTVNIPALTVTDVDLAFKAGADPNFESTGLLVNPDTASFNIWFSKDVPSDPNLYLIDAIEAGSLSDPNRTFPLSSYAAGVLTNGTTYQWQVEQVLTNPLTSLPYAAGDPNNLLSPVWSFTTSNAKPVITPKTPYHTLTDLTGAGSLTVEASAVANNYRWFKVVGEQDTAGLVDDIELSDGTLDGVTYAGTDTATLNISGMASDGSEDAQYYAIAYNGIPGDSATVQSEPSDTAWVWYPRETNRFTFEETYAVDSNSFVADQIGSSDIQLTSDDGTLDVPSIDPNNPDAPGLLGSKSLYFNNPNTNSDPNNADGQYARISDTSFCAYKDITISAWIYHKGGGWQRILSVGSTDGSGTNGIRTMYFTPSGNNNAGALMLNVNGQSVTAPGGSVPQNEWAYVTATLSGNVAKLYVNGEWVATNNNLTNDPIADAPAENIMLARSQWWNYDTLFNGYIADLRIWNYGLTTDDVAQAYMDDDTNTGYVCESEINDLPYDYNDDCIINLGDFAIFASTWLDTYRILPTP